MVKEMMNRVEADCQLASPPRVCDYFDMICGSGFGGILAIMCGILKMTGDQLIHEFVNLVKAVFAEGLDMTQRTVVLEREMKVIIGKYSKEGRQRKIFCEDDTCKTFVCAAAFHNTGHPRLFRNYHVRANSSVDCMLWEAAYATASMPDLFKPIVIGDMNIGEMFVGGNLRWNNPTDVLTKEAADVFKGCKICSIISIGSGHSGHMSLSKGLADLFPRIALDCERVADDKERRFGNTPEVFWRLNVEQGLQDLAADLSNLDAVVSHTHSYLQSARTIVSINALLQDLIRRPERISVDGISGLAPAVLVLRRKLCPPPTQHFTGRLSELKKLDEYFNSARKSRLCRVGVLYGIGGGGKSQIGLEFIMRSQSQFNDIFFVDASDKYTLENDLKTIAIGVSDKPTIEDALHLLRTTKEEWLLFLDNADDPSLDLRPYFSWSHGNVLITTRNPEVRMHAPDCSIRVDQLELDDAVKLLLRGLDVDETLGTRETASEIVQKLGCLALAVNQARAFLAQNICSLSEYLPIYMKNRQKLLEDRLIQTTDDYKHTVYTTWTISFNKLSSPAVRLVELLCFMHHEGIPSRIFEDAWKAYTEEDNDGDKGYKEDENDESDEGDENNESNEDEDIIPTSLVTFLSSFQAVGSTWDILRFRMLIKEILSFSLIEFNINNHTFSLHPLVQQWAQSQCHHSQETIRSTQTLLSLATPEGQKKEDMVLTLSLLPHLRASAQTGLDLHFTLLHYLGVIYDRGGMFQECAAVYEQETSMMQKEFGLEHPDTLTSMSNLASAYSDLGRHKDALELMNQVLALSNQILGEEHPDTLTSLDNLASIYSDLGQYQEALKLIEQVLHHRTRILGEEHPDTVTSMNNLASAYSDVGQDKDALKLMEQVLALSTRTLGKEHPDTLTSMSNLASAYSDLGLDKDALKLKEEVLALSTQVLGEEHPDTLSSMSSLASTYSDLGQDKEALRLKEQVLALSTQILGEEHPDTLMGMSSLAVTCSDLGQHGDALKLKEKVLTLSTQILEKEHPNTLTSMSDLASTYSDLGQHKDAMKLGQQVLALSCRILGEEHPDSLTSMNNLASTYSDLGQHDDALKLIEQELALRRQIQGEEHPDTLITMNNLAITYSDLGQDTDALKLIEQVLALRTQIIGEEHPDTLTSMNNLACIYSDLGQHRDALAIHEQTFTMRQRVLGPEHPDTVTSSERVEEVRAGMAKEKGWRKRDKLSRLKRGKLGKLKRLVNCF
ncbi:hypothetical protein DL96DRAFT_1810696 [Flagelloscypha sp. PMI_526]|nr:hypothetical protein DL96DRAFT_1810696 [Flagelloscypha sp. PMI_526]